MTARVVVRMSVLMLVAAVVGTAAWGLGYALGIGATWWVAGGVFVVVCLGGVAVAVRAERARRAADRSSRFVTDDTTGITIGGLSVEDYLSREEGRLAAEKRKQGGDGDEKR